MKYMGAKNAMLKNGLGTVLLSEATRATRFIDPFCGSAAVAWFAASMTDKKVIASDLQHYSVVMADAVVSRTYRLDPSAFADQWFDSALESIHDLPQYLEALKLSKHIWADRSVTLVKDTRTLSAECPLEFSITKSYGGHYFSAYQSLVLDALRKSLPKKEQYRKAALASLISASSACAAAPGHTAQPFQPTEQASSHLFDAWHRDPFHYVRKALLDICQRTSRVEGEAHVRDARDLSSHIQAGDLVFVDPPYSSVQYSRFYHVLETMARGVVSEVAGAGRYPPRSERPQSAFSLKSKAADALEDLLKQLSGRQVRIILTFPKGKTSLGLSGIDVRAIAERYFEVAHGEFHSSSSTLGGSGATRPARRKMRELYLLLT